MKASIDQPWPFLDSCSLSIRSPRPAAKRPPPSLLCPNLKQLGPAPQASVTEAKIIITYTDWSWAHSIMFISVEAFTFNSCGESDQLIIGNYLSFWISQKMAERSEAKSAKRCFASKLKIRDILTRSFASLSQFFKTAEAKFAVIAIFLNGLRNNEDYDMKV